MRDEIIEDSLDGFVIDFDTELMQRGCLPQKEVIIQLLNNFNIKIKIKTFLMKVGELLIETLNERWKERCKYVIKPLSTMEISKIIKKKRKIFNKEKRINKKKRINEIQQHLN